MNPIYRHSFVNALLANGAFASTTGMIDGNNNNYFYTCLLYTSPSPRDRG